MTYQQYLVLHPLVHALRNRTRLRNQLFRPVVAVLMTKVVQAFNQRPRIERVTLWLGLVYLLLRLLELVKRLAL